MLCSLLATPNNIVDTIVVGISSKVADDIVDATKVVELTGESDLLRSMKVGGLEGKGGNVIAFSTGQVEQSRAKFAFCVGACWLQALQKTTCHQKVCFSLVVEETIGKQL